MKIENLKEGMVIKNYKELCKILEIKEKSSNSKEAQLKELKTYCNFHKNVRAFVIDEIYDKQLLKVDGRSSGNNVSPYIQYLELLILNFLLYSKGEIKIATNGLLKVCEVINNNYTNYYGKLRPLLVQKFDTNIEYVNDYFYRVGGMLKGNIKTVLNRLEKSKLIINKPIYMIVQKEAVANNYTKNGKIKICSEKFIDDEGIEHTEYHASKLKVETIYREPTTKELKNILKIERQVYLELGLNENSNMSDIIKKGLRKEFDEKVSKLLMEEMNIERYYKAYHLIYNNEDIELEKEFILDSIQKGLYSELAVGMIQDKIMENCINRWYESQLEVKLDSSIWVDSKYVSTYSELNDFMIRKQENQ